jgi:hypothetical protein
VHDLFPGAAAFHQIEHRQAEDDDEVRPDRFTHPADDLHRQAHAVFVAAAPAVGAVVGVGGEELVNEIAFRAHDFDAVVFGRCARVEQVTKSRICFSMPSSSSSLGLNGLIGAWMALGATCFGL